MKPGQWMRPRPRGAIGSFVLVRTSRDCLASPWNERGRPVRCCTKPDWLPSPYSTVVRRPATVRERGQQVRGSPDYSDASLQATALGRLRDNADLPTAGNRPKLLISRRPPSTRPFNVLSKRFLGVRLHKQNFRGSSIAVHLVEGTKGGLGDDRRALPVPPTAIAGAARSAMQARHYSEPLLHPLPTAAGKSGDVPRRLFSIETMFRGVSILCAGDARPPSEQASCWRSASAGSILWSSRSSTARIREPERVERWKAHARVRPLGNESRPTLCSPTNSAIRRRSLGGLRLLYRSKSLQPIGLRR